MKRMAEQDFGVEFKFDPLVNPRIDCSSSPLGVRLIPEDVVALDFHDCKRRDEYCRLADHDLSLESGVNHDGTNGFFGGGGMNGCAIDPTGKVSICVISQQEHYDWRKGSFEEGWNGSLLSTRNKQKTRQTRCDRCRIQSLCSMCPANGELEAGDPESPVDFLCQVAHLRAYTLGYEVPEHGDCPCCEGGIHHAALNQSSNRLRSKQVDVGSWTPQPAASSLLPILGSQQGGGGCGSCRQHG